MAGNVGNALQRAGAGAAGAFRRTWNGALNALRGPIGQLAGTLGAMWSVAKVVEFGRSSVMAAAESEAIWGRLGGTLATVGLSLTKHRAELDAAAQAFQRNTVFDDEAYLTTVQKLVTISGDYAGSLKNVGIVADFASAMHLDLETAALIVGKAMTGETGTLSRYGVVVKEGADALEVMRQKFAGMAANEVNTFSGQMAQLNNEWGNFKEALGGIVVGGAGAGTFLQQITRQIRGLTGWIEENGAEIGKWIGVIVDGAQAVSVTVMAPVRLLFNMGGALAGIFKLAANGLTLLKNTAIDALPGFDRTEQIAQDTLDIADAQQILRTVMSNMGQTVVTVKDAWSDLGRAMFTTARAQKEVIDQTHNFTEAAAGGGGPNLGQFGAVGVRDMSGVLGGARKLSFPKRLEAAGESDRHREMREAAEEEMAMFMDNVTMYAENITDVWTASFEAIGSGANVFQALRQAVGGTAKTVLTELTKGKVAYHMAEGIGKLASGIWPPNPLSLLSAGKHFLAAAAFKAIPGIAGGAISGGGSAGSMGAGAGTGMQTDQGNMRQKITGPDINLYIDGMDPGNPKHQARVGAATRDYQERTGGRIVNHSART
jgi:hypothetical protein